MSRVAVSLVALSVAALPVVGTEKKSGYDADAIEAEVRELNDLMNHAYENNDLERYWAFFAEDMYFVWDTRAWVTLEEYKQEWTAYIDGGGGVIALHPRDTRVTIGPRGVTAIVSAHYSVRYRRLDGSERDESVFETDVWFKRNGKWAIAYTHGSQE